MAGAATSIRFIAPGPSGVDALHRILSDLSTRGPPKVPIILLLLSSDFCACVCFFFLDCVVFALLVVMCVRHGEQEGSTSALRKHVEEEARDLSGEAFSRFMDQLYDRISALLESSDVADNLGALRAMDELIDVPLGESASMVSRFSYYMRMVFEAKKDQEVLILASRVLGHLARAGGAMTADDVERQVSDSFVETYRLCLALYDELN